MKGEMTPTKENAKANTRFYITMIVVLLVFLLLFQIVKVQGVSMQNTLMAGDYLLIVRDWLVDEYHRGDIVVISKSSYHGGELIIKRIIATEGQIVDIDENGILYVDGHALEEPYVKTSTYECDEISFPFTVGKGCFFRSW